jgi:hypothetical protein
VRVMEVVLLITAIGPVFALGILCFFFFRAARRNDERERAGL